MQKPTLIILSALVLPVMPFTTHAQLASQAAGTQAANTEPSKPAAPPDDPFTRPARRTSSPASAAAKPKGDAAPTNLLTTLETWAVSAPDALALLEVRDKQDAGYAHLLALESAGKARLIGLTALSSKSGNRSVSEASDSVRYPVEFDPPWRKGDIAFPVSWETRDAGDVLEMEAFYSDDGSNSISLNVVPRVVRFDGFEDIVADPEGAPISTAQFSESTVRTLSLLTANLPSVLSVSKPATSRDGEQAAPEIHVQIIRTARQPAPAPVPTPAALAPNGGARVEFLVYQLDRTDAARLLRDSAGPEVIHTALRERVSGGKAVLEAFSAFATQSGNRSVHEEGREWPMTHGMNSPKYVGEGPAAIKVPGTPRAFEAKAVGTSIEIEAVIDPDTRFVDVNVIPSIVSYLGFLQSEGVAQKYTPQPLFSTRKITTNVTAGYGQPMLLGTMSQPRDSGVNGRKDDGKTSLAFIRLVPLNP